MYVCESIKLSSCYEIAENSISLTAWCTLWPLHPVGVDHGLQLVCLWCFLSHLHKHSTCTHVVSPNGTCTGGVFHTLAKYSASTHATCVRIHTCIALWSIMYLYIYIYICVCVLLKGVQLKPCTLQELVWISNLMRLTFCQMHQMCVCVWCVNKLYVHNTE